MGATITDVRGTDSCSSGRPIDLAWPLKSAIRSGSLIVLKRSKRRIPPGMSTSPWYSSAVRPEVKKRGGSPAASLTVRAP